MPPLEAAPFLPTVSVAPDLSWTFKANKSIGDMISASPDTVWLIGNDTGNPNLMGFPTTQFEDVITTQNMGQQAPRDEASCRPAPSSCCPTSDLSGKPFCVMA